MYSLFAPCDIFRLTLCSNPLLLSIYLSLSKWYEKKIENISFSFSHILSLFRSSYTYHETENIFLSKSRRYIVCRVNVVIKYQKHSTKSFKMCMRWLFKLYHKSHVKNSKALFDLMEFYENSTKHNLRIKIDRHI